METIQEPYPGIRLVMSDDVPIIVNSNACWTVTAVKARAVH